MVIQRPGNVDMEDGCVFLMQLSPPTNLNAGDIQHYIITHQMGRVTIIGSSGTFIVARNCTRSLRVQVFAVNRCGMEGESTPEVMPMFLPGPSPPAGDSGGSESLFDVHRMHDES